MESRHGNYQSQEQRETAKNPEDLTAFVKNLLEQMQSRFQTMSQSIITKIDEMGSRIDDLEKSIEDLTIETAGEVSPSSSLSPSDQSGTN